MRALSNSDPAPILIEREAQEALLVERVREGDARAFVTLYQAYGPLVERVCRENVHDPESVADVAQEVFTRALERLATLRDPRRFRPWLLAIARNAAIDHRRRVQGSPTSSEEPPDVGSTEPGPDELAELTELASLVRGCVAELSLRDATTVAMVTYLGFSSAEVAGVLGVTPNAAKVAVHRARARLRQALGLQLLARGRSPDCTTFAGLRDRGELLAAGRHTASCGICSTAVDAEVSAYDHQTTPTDAASRLDGIGGHPVLPTP